MLEDLKINRRARDSVSTQIVEHVRTQILTRQLKPGQRLPTTAEIIRRVGVGTHTVRDALAQLEQEGFLEVTQGRGTFVSPKALAQDADQGEKRRKLTRVALSSAYADLARPQIRSSDLYRVNSVQGFLDECARLDISGTILTDSKLKAESVGSLHEYLLELNCDGLVWLYPGSKDWAKVRYLQEKGFPVVVTRRSHLNDHVASVESDEFKAGVMAGGHMAEKGCTELVVFSYFDESGHTQIERTDFPIGFNDGLKSVVDRCQTLTSNQVRFLHPRTSEKGAATFIKETLGRLNEGCGVIFNSGVDFFQFVLKATPEELEILSRHEVIVSTTRYWALKFAPLVRDLDFQAFIQPFAEVSRCAVQKLRNIIDGNLENTTTLVSIEFADFWQYWRREVARNGDL